MKNLNPVEYTKLFNPALDGTITLNGGGTASDDEKIPISTLNSGYFALAIKFDATSHTDARLTASYKVSPDGVEFIKSESGNAIKAAMHEGGGENSDGLYHVQVYIPPCVAFEITLTETASQNAVFQAWLVTQ